MMPNGQEVASGLRGAWRLLRFDASGMAAFDQSVEGFWKSFYAAALTAPGYVIVLALHLGDAELAVGFFHLLIIESLVYVIEWTAFPLAAYYAVDMMGKDDRYIGFIVALNWSRVIQLAIYLPILLLVASGAFSPQVGDLLSFATFIAVMTYQWYVTRTALAINGLAAFLLVVLDLVISLVITGITDGMIT